MKRYKNKSEQEALIAPQMVPIIQEEPEPTHYTTEVPQAPSILAQPSTTLSLSK